jgi:hypothetical protein
MLFDCYPDNWELLLKNVYDTGELIPVATTEKFSVVRQERNRTVNRNLQFYSLDAIIAVGYRVNCIRSMQFRQWATKLLQRRTNLL